MYHCPLHCQGLSASRERPLHYLLLLLTSAFSVVCVIGHVGLCKTCTAVKSQLPWGQVLLADILIKNPANAKKFNKWMYQISVQHG